MTILTGGVTLLGQETTVSCEVNFVDSPTTGKLKVGFTYPTNTGENQAEATERLFKEFPNGKCYRVFRSSDQTLPSWTSGLMAKIPNDVVIIVSSKNTGCVNELPAWLSAKPARFTQPVVFCYHHEPDQFLVKGTSSGDPSPTSFSNTWQMLVSKVANHSQRENLILCPIFTEFIARGDAKKSNEQPVTREEWKSAYHAVLSMSGVDMFGFDVYQTGYQNYRTPKHMWDVSLEYCREYEKKLVVGEWGIERRSYDSSGNECAQVMADQISYLSSQPEAFAVAWYYNGNDVLSTPTGIAREPEHSSLGSSIDSLV